MKFIELKLSAAMSASLLISVLGLPTFAQDAENVAGRAGQTEATLAPGSTISVELNSSIDSKKAKAGDPVAARTSEALRSADDRLIIPKGAKIEGHVTQASARNKGGNESALGIQFDRAFLKDGGEILLNVIIRAMAGPVSFPAPGDLGTTPNLGTTQTSPMRNAPPPTPQAPTGGIERDGSSATSQPLDAKSRGVIGLHGITLKTEVANNRPASVVVSNGKSVRLDGGTQMLLVEQAPASEPSGQ
jgi:hypothetical protein